MGYLVERSIGKGRLILCSLDLESGRIEADYLLRQMCRYMMSGNKPACIELAEESIGKIISAGKASDYCK